MYLIEKIKDIFFKSRIRHRFYGYSKRLATKSEIDQAFATHIHHWNSFNPNSIKSVEWWKAKQDEAEAEGYKNETCSCGNVFLAFHHYTTCKEKGCPISNGVPLIEEFYK